MGLPNSLLVRDGALVTKNGAFVVTDANGEAGCCCGPPTCEECPCCVSLTTALCVTPAANAGVPVTYHVTASVSYSQATISPASTTVVTGSIDGNYSGFCGSVTATIPLTVTTTTGGGPPVVGSGGGAVEWGLSGALGGSNFSAINGRRATMRLGAAAGGYGSATGAFDADSDSAWQINFQGATIGSVTGSNSAFAGGSASVGGPCLLTFSWTASYDDGNVSATATYEATLSGPLLCVNPADAPAQGPCSGCGDRAVPL